MKTLEDYQKLTVTELAKGLSEAEIAIDKAATDAKAASDAAAAELKKRDDRIAELEKAAKGEPEATDIYKGLNPALRAELEKRDADAKADREKLAKVMDERADETAIAKAMATYPHVPATTAAELGPIMKRVASNATTAADLVKLDQIMKAASAIVDKGLSGVEAGVIVHKAAADTAIGQVTILAQEIMKADPKMSLNEAQGQVFKAHPELAERHRAEMNAPKG